MCAMRRAILHIGSEKTGSTSIQAGLSANRKKLLEAGILFPKSAGPMNHTRLVVACLDDDVVDNIKAHYLARTGLDSLKFRAQFEAKFDEELSRCPDWKTLVVSSELVQSRLCSETEVARLIKLLRRYVDRIDVVIYLRRQDRLAVSRFSSAIRAGYPSFDGVFGDLSPYAFLELPEGGGRDDMNEFFDYDRVISRFEGLGPDVVVRPIVFDPPGERPDPVAAFSDCLDEVAGSRLPKQASAHLNAAMSVKAQWVIAALNAERAPRLKDGRRDKRRIALLRRVERELVGPARQVSRASAESFLERFSESNEAIRRRYFPNQAVLFESSFEMYPDSIDYSEIAEECAAVLEGYRSEGAMRPGWKRAMKQLWTGLNRRV